VFQREGGKDSGSQHGSGVLVHQSQPAGALAVAEGNILGSIHLPDVVRMPSAFRFSGWSSSTRGWSTSFLPQPAAQRSGRGDGPSAIHLSELNAEDLGPPGGMIRPQRGHTLTERLVLGRESGAAGIAWCQRIIAALTKLTHQLLHGSDL